MTLAPIDPKQTALVVIDLQRGIAAMPTSPHSAATVIENTKKIGEKLRAAGGQIFLIRVAFSSDMGDTLKVPSDQTFQRPPGSMPADFSEIVPELATLSEFVITKKQWGAFTGTDLEIQLRRRGITTIILTGVSTNMGVESTARFANELNFRQVFPEDAMSSRSTEEHEHTVRKIFPRLGNVVTTEQVLAAL